MSTVSIPDPKAPDKAVYLLDMTIGRWWRGVGVLWDSPPRGTWTPCTHESVPTHVLTLAYPTGDKERMDVR